jgi:hypothetical protein
VTIAAGTTVWKDVAEGTLALNEKTQTGEQATSARSRRKAEHLRRRRHGARFDLQGLTTHVRHRRRSCAA